MACSDASSVSTYCCDACGGHHESVGVLAEAVRVNDTNGVERICIACADDLEPETVVKYVNGSEAGWGYCSVCSMPCSPSSDNPFADWRFPLQLLTCTRCREAWTLEDWNCKLVSMLQHRFERSGGTTMVAGYTLSGQRLEFVVPLECRPVDLITALELASGERMGLWKVISGDALIASAADKYCGEAKWLPIAHALLGRDLTFLKGATKVTLRILEGGAESWGNDELASLISHSSCS